MNIPACFLVIIIYPAQAFAYIDPGAGSLIIQMAIAAIMGAMFTIKLYWYKFKYFILKLFGKLPPEEAGDDAKENQEE